MGHLCYRVVQAHSQENEEVELPLLYDLVFGSREDLNTVIILVRHSILRNTTVFVLL